MSGPVAVGRAQPASDLTGFGCAQPGVKPDRFPEMGLGLIPRAGCLVRAGQTVVRARLLVEAAGLLGQVTRGGVVEKTVFRPPHGEGEFAKTIERLGFTCRVVTVPEQGDGQLVWSAAW